MGAAPLRLFDSPLLEACSKTPWWTVPILWLPLALAALAHAVAAAGLVAAAGYAALGFAAWLCLEYALHRFLFHAHVVSRAGITLHFAFHGCHHKQPQDGLRLVFPPLFAAPLVAFFRAALAAALPGPGRARAAFGGMLAGYVAYDCTHYWSHHAGTALPAWLAGVRAAHLAHHFRDSSRGFGVSSSLLDALLGTLPLR